MADLSKETERCLSLYGVARSMHQERWAEWRRIAAHCLPWQEHWWIGEASPGDGNTQAWSQFDPVGSQAIQRQSSRLVHYTTPAGQRWHTLEPEDLRLLKHRDVQIYVSAVSDTLFRKRYEPQANFESSVIELYQSLLAYGTGVLYVGVRPPGILDTAGGFQYRFCALRDSFILTNENNDVVSVFYRFFLNPRQFKERFPNLPYPSQLDPQDSTTSAPDFQERNRQEFLHWVWRKDLKKYRPNSRDLDRFPIGARYVHVAGREFVGPEHGFRSMPYLVSRLGIQRNEPYGRGPSSLAVASMSLANLLHKNFAAVAQSRAQPPLLAPDMSMLNDRVDLRPNRVNYGGLDPQGRQLIRPLEIGQMNVPHTLFDMVNAETEAAFGVSTPFEGATRRTATEALEIRQSQEIELSRVLMPIQQNFLAPLVERDVTLADDTDLLPEPPAVMRESGVHLVPVFTSPMARSRNLEELSALVRTFEVLAQTFQITGDRSVFDILNLDKALLEYAQRMGVPAAWLNSKERIAELREERARKEETQEAVAAAPAVAGILKTAGLGQG